MIRHLQSLPPDMVRAAFPEPSRAKWPSQSFRNRSQSQNRTDSKVSTNAMRLLKAADPFYYNSLIDRHTGNYRAKPTIKKGLLKNGFLTDDGSVCMNRSEKMGVKRAMQIIEEREAKLNQIEARERERLKRLKRVVSFGQVNYAHDGIAARTSRGSDDKGSISTDRRQKNGGGNATHAQLASGQVAANSLSVPWKTLPHPSSSNATRLPSILKVQGEPKATCLSKPQKTIPGANSGRACSLDPVQRAKFRDMLNQEEEALRKLISIELQSARKAEQKAKQVEERTARREAIFKVELEVEKKRNIAERKRKVALQALVAECERWAKTRRQKASSFNMQVEQMKQRVNKAIKEKNMLSHSAPTDGNAKLMSNGSVVMVSKEHTHVVVEKTSSAYTVRNSKESSNTTTGIMAVSTEAVCPSNASTMAASTGGVSKATVMTVPSITASPSNTSTTAVSKVPSNAFETSVPMTITSKEPLTTAASSSSIKIGATSDSSNVAMPAPPSTSGESPAPDSVVACESSESMQSAKTVSSEGTPIHAAGEPISQMVATPAMEKATPSPISKISARISRATNTSPHLLDTYIAGLFPNAKGKTETANGAMKTSAQAHRKHFQPADEVTTEPPTVGEFPSIPRLRSRADVCSDVDTVLAESCAGSSDILSTASSLCTNGTSQSLQAKMKHYLSTSDIGEALSKPLTFSGKSCLSKCGNEARSPKAGGQHTSDTGSSSQYSSRWLARPPTPIAGLLSEASSGLHHFSSGLQRIGEDTEMECGSTDVTADTDGEAAIQEPCMTRDSALTTRLDEQAHKTPTSVSVIPKKCADGLSFGSNDVSDEWVYLSTVDGICAPNPSETTSATSKMGEEPHDYGIATRGAEGKESVFKSAVEVVCSQQTKAHTLAIDAIRGEVQTSANKTLVHLPKRDTNKKKIYLANEDSSPRVNMAVPSMQHASAEVFPPSLSDAYIFEAHTGAFQEDDLSRFEDAMEEPLPGSKLQVSLKSADGFKTTIPTNKKVVFLQTASSPQTHYTGEGSVHPAEPSNLLLSRSAPPSIYSSQTPPSVNSPQALVSLLQNDTSSGEVVVVKANRDKSLKTPKSLKLQCGLPVVPPKNNAINTERRELVHTSSLLNSTPDSKSATGSATKGCTSIKE